MKPCDFLFVLALVFSFGLAFVLMGVAGAIVMHFTDRPVFVPWTCVVVLLLILGAARFIPFRKGTGDAARGN